jgi:hypothetical protein
MKGTKEKAPSPSDNLTNENPLGSQPRGLKYLKISEDEGGTLVPVADKVPHGNLGQCFYLGNRKTYLTLKKRAGERANLGRGRAHLADCRRAI